MTNYDFLGQAYDQNAWKNLIRTLFPSNADVFARAEPIEADNERIESFTQFGTIRLNDQQDTQLALFEIKLRPKTTKLQINRVALNKIVSKINENALLTGALALYVDDEKKKWRFSFIAKRQQYNQSGELETWETEPKRYTYVFGEGEKTLTARQRFERLAGNGHKTLNDLAEAFSVEKIGDEFFKKYKEHYKHLCEDLYANPSAKAVFGDDQKAMRDFVKKLMGRLVFLYFLQKKGWLGAAPSNTAWHNGDPDFIARLFQESPQQAQFHSRELRQMFYHTLNERRANDAFQAPWGMVRVPYLNGGLFDDDLPEANALDFAPQRFVALFEFFNAFNFTVDENSPNDHEVGIDPEMLGHIFENLLEENKEKGAYYTPKEIVHYMCQESLLEYLKTQLLSKNKPVGVVWSDSRDSDTAELTEFVRHKTRGRKDNFIHKNARYIESCLRKVRICDPAIGSGAFPMGLLHEIFLCQIELDLTEDLAALKKDIIHHCIYGVDKDKGAVDIARLRFWLSLVVDEDTPQELPNLDYKIMQGDSLLESFEGIDLSRIIADEQAEKPFAKSEQGNLFGPVGQQTLIQFEGSERNNVVQLMDRFFNVPEKAEKGDIHQKIEGKVSTALNNAIRKTKIGLLLDQGELKKQLESKRGDKKTTLKLEKEITRLEAEIVACEHKQTLLDEANSRTEKPWFLWKLYFKDVFDQGGFDIVIGNPPYVQLQKLGAYTDTLQRAGFETFARTGDLYCLFYERAIRILKPGGILAYITSNSWLKTQYGELLRRYFTTYTDPLALLNFEDAQLFKAAIVEANILLAQKGDFRDRLRAGVLGKDYTPGQPFAVYLEEKGVAVSGLSKEAWHIGNAKVVALKIQIEGEWKRLKDWEVTINFGIKTGFNEAFIIDEKTKIELVSNNHENQKIIKPLLRGRDVQKYSYNFENYFLIFIPWHFPLHFEYELSGVSENAENAFRRNHPLIYDHLSKYKEQLSKRNQSETGIRYEWYALQRWGAKYYEDFEKPKIIWADIADKPKFVFDENQYYTNDRCWIMTGNKLKYLLAILNSKICEWYFNEISTTSGMGTIMWKKYKIEQLPIAKASEKKERQIEILADYLLWLNDKSKLPASVNADNKQLAHLIEEVLNMAIYELYFEDHMKELKIDVLEFLSEDSTPPLQGNDHEKAAIISKVFLWLLETGNPVRTRIQASNILSPDIIRYINSSTI